jgi:hypothetical protein
MARLFIPSLEGHQYFSMNDFSKGVGLKNELIFTAWPLRKKHPKNLRP